MVSNHLELIDNEISMADINGQKYALAQTQQAVLVEKANFSLGYQTRESRKNRGETMMIETVIRWMGGLLAFSTLGFLFYSIWRGSQRQAGRTTGRNTAWLRSPVFYLIATTLFLGIAWLGWIPLPVNLSPLPRMIVLAVGALLYFPGLAFVLWGRLALGKNYFVSTGMGAQLFADQQLVTNGPYALVRHPMYVGLALAAWGALLIYFTWTTIYFAVFAPMLFLRARREEQALAAEFGEQWHAYCRRVPAFLPHFHK